MSDARAEKITLFAAAERVFPKRVEGRFRSLKWAAMVVLLGIYYLVPFLRWERGPHAPDQAVLIDMPNSKAYFFFFEIWPQEVYVLTGLLVLGAVGLFFVTSLFGRVWCGYACPQTVWTDLFVWVERLVQGDRNKRKRLHKAPWSLEKLWKLTLTHAIWLMIGLFTGGAWVLYFNDAPSVISDLFTGTLSSSVWTWILALTLSTYFMAGFARENVCTYYCPYSRFQSAMFDKDSMIIGYDEARGEKRGSHKKGDSWEGRGHCIDCNQCVDVCPMGIDIRDGLQMQCIACGLCIDACNGIMDKVGLPHGLVRYDTVHNQDARAAGLSDAETSHFVRPRTLYYTVILALVGSVLLYSLLNRVEHELHVLRDRNPLFVQMSNGDIRNNYQIKILNKTHEDRVYGLHVTGAEGLKVRVQAAGTVTPDALPVFADSVAPFRLFVTAPKQSDIITPIKLEIRDSDGVVLDTYTSQFVSGDQ